MAVQKDEGYAWVVLAGSLVINFLTIGFCFGVIGVLTAEYESEFGAELTQASSIGSTLLALVLLSGPLAAVLIGKLGVRLVAVIAVVVHLSGFLLSAFAKDWWHVIPSFAILSGIASCCSHVCTMKIITVYFDRHLQMAYAASALGSDAAAIAFPFITTGILDKLSYRDSILAMSAILALAIPFAISFKGAPGHSCGQQETKAKKNESVAAEEELTKLHDDGQGEKLTQTHEEFAKDTAASDCNGNLHVSGNLDVERVDNSKPDEENHTLRDHLYILSKPTLLVFIANSFLWYAGGAVMSVITFPYCKEHGFSDNAASLVMTMFGVGSFVGSMFVTISSYLSHHFNFKFNRYYLHLACNLIMAVTAVIVPFVSFSWAAVTLCLFIIGAGYGTLCSNMGSVIEHLNGQRLLYLVYSYQMAMAGAASLLGPLIGAELDSVFGSGKSFFFAGACMCSAFVLFVIYAVINNSVLTPYSGSAEESLPSDLPGNVDLESKI